MSMVMGADDRRATEVGVRDWEGCWLGVGVRALGGGVGVGVGVDLCRFACWLTMAAAIC
jgi:hypothetical protein